MRCGHCGVELTQPVRFCTQCGLPVQLVTPSSPPPIASKSPPPIPSSRPLPTPPRSSTAVAKRPKHSRAWRYVLVLLLLVVLGLGGWWGMSWRHAHRIPRTQTSALRLPPAPIRPQVPIARSTTVTSPASVTAHVAVHALRQPVARTSLSTTPALSSSPTATQALSIAPRTQPLGPPLPKAHPTPHAVAPNPYASQAYKQQKEKELKKLLKGH